MDYYLTFLDMSYFANIKLDPNSIGTAPSGAQRVAQLTTLFDGKTLNTDDTDFWENVGTGTATFAENMCNMSVTGTQHIIRHSRRFMPYFSWKPQVIEMTFDNFQTQANVTKKVGYFSSVATTPYATNYDGFWIEDDGTTKRLVVYRKNTLQYNVAFADWSGYSQLQSYDWSKFTVIMFDFLWLGGAALRLWVCTPTGWVLAHTLSWCGTGLEQLILSPNQTVRYELRSAGATGALGAICSQVATEGSINESGKALALYNTASISCNSVGTIYALAGIRKTTAQRDVSVKIQNMSVINTASTDAGILLLIKNPTLSASITYADTSRVSWGEATTQTITAGTGRILYATVASTAGASLDFRDEYMTWLSGNIDNVMDQYVIAYMPTTANQSVNGVLNIKEYF